MDRARLFLESMYVPEAGFLRAAVTAVPDSKRIYIASDNLLAAEALSIVGSGLGNKLKQKLSAEFAGGFNQRHEVLLGYDIPDKFYVHADEKVGEIHSTAYNLTFEILYEKPDYSRVFEDWPEYADLLAYRCLDLLLAGENSKARELFSVLLQMWDGYGFNDKPHRTDPNSRYETYKTALALIVCKKIEKNTGSCSANTQTINKWIALLTSLQRDDGGVVTHYVVREGVVTPFGDANTETTSITLLALMKN
ncbi:MAG: hypothetical protein RMI43_02410 [Candidatus Caldarchaeum sp.]|nr:hypothetical protein [Candidatus Caldarchaeum sp.]